MRELRQSSCRRARVAWLGRPLGLVVLGLFMAVNVAASQSEIETDASVRQSTGVVRPAGSLFFQKALPFETAFLSRVAEMAVERKRMSARDAEAAAPGADDFAKRYGISRDLARRIVNVARAEGVDPELAFRLVRVESRFVTRAVGPGGSLGLTQLMPSTARSIDRTMNTKDKILDPQNNLRMGFGYLREMIERYKGDVRLGVLAYNRGEVAVDRALRSGRDPENGYSHLVLGTKSANPYRGRGLLKKSE